MDADWKDLSARLTQTLGLQHSPVAMAFVEQAPDDLGAFAAPMTEPTADGRSGRAPASCVFWMHAAESAFSTVAPDHGNCSVGLWVHGFAAPADILDKSDVGALLESGWVSMDAVGSVTAIADGSPAILYGPLGDVTFEPDIVVLRVTPAQMMQLGDATSGVELSGKPQCQIIAKAKEHGTIAASMGCALSRERTGMSDTELTCAVPAAALPDIMTRLGDVARADAMVQSYARAAMAAAGSSS